MKITENFLEKISVFSACSLLLIWVLPSTIAFRNILLVIGGCTGILLIRLNWMIFCRYSFRAIPLYLILGLFIWVLIHYLFFSLNPELELSEIRGLWLRTFAGFFMAIGLGVALYKNNHLRKFFFFSLFFVPIINVIAYCYASYLNGALVKPNDFVRFLFIKIETTFFGAIASGCAIANLIQLLVIKKQKDNFIKIIPYLLGLVLVMLSALLVGTKNGVAISIALCLIFGLVLLIDILLNFRKTNLVTILACLILVVAIVVVWKGHKASAYEGWDSIFSDAKVAVQIDQYRQWQKGEHDFDRPTNDMGTLVVGNTYFRLAWATVGTRLIANYPFGYGSINRSFVGLLDEAKLDHVHQGQVHSGWIDFGLAFGIPGLALIFSCMIFIFVCGIMRPSLMNLCAVMIVVAIFPMGIIAEISYKQYFEATIFFITLASSLILLDKKLPSKDISND